MTKFELDMYIPLTYPYEIMNETEIFIKGYNSVKIHWTKTKFELDQHLLTLNPYDMSNLS
jgi:hypothetical protein